MFISKLVVYFQEIEQGRITESGAICPSLNTFFGMKRVNHGKIWFVPEYLGALLSSY